MQCSKVETIIGGRFPVIVRDLIAAAKKSVHIVVFDWRWYPHDPGCACQLFNNAIIEAKKRGIVVSVLTNCIDVLNILRQNGVFAKKPISRRLLHSKMMIIDEKHLVIGSHNYTQNAFTSNFESSVVLHDCDDLSEFLNYFNSLGR